MTINNDVFLFGQQIEPQKYMVYFDILLFPTKREGFGLVAAEANSLGIPVVGYDIPGLRDAVSNKKTGTLVHFGDRIKLLNAVLSYYNSPKLKKLHGENGRVRVIKKFEQTAIWEGYHAKYLELSQS